jgi:protein-disulfide isomerase
MLRRSLIAGSFASAAFTILPLKSAATPEQQLLPSNLIADVLQLDGRVLLGNLQADVIIIEFFDYNCPYCRNSAKDLFQLIKADKNLGYVLINYAVLSEASIQAAKVALAFTMQKFGQKTSPYASFHQKLFERKGVIGSDHAIDVAINLGADKARLIKDADSDAVTKALIASAKLGENLGFIATPSYIVGNTGVQGYASLVEKKRFVSNMRVCEKTVC